MSLRVRNTVIPNVVVAGVLALAGALMPTDTPRQGQWVVVLDPGHGGDETGAVSGPLIERDSNLDMARRVEAILAGRGVKVVLTRTGADRPLPAALTLAPETATFLDLQTRIAIANSARADLFVSIHSNYWVNAQPRGLEVYYNPQRGFAEQSRELAGDLIEGVADSLRTAGVDVSANAPVEDISVADAAGYQTPYLVLGPSREITLAELADRGIEAAALGLSEGDAGFRTRATRMPGALVELLYVSNPRDAALLLDSASRDAMAAGIASAVLRFLGLE